jgi:hypothetical protein
MNNTALEDAITAYITLKLNKTSILLKNESEKEKENFRNAFPAELSDIKHKSDVQVRLGIYALVHQLVLQEYKGEKGELNQNTIGKALDALRVTEYEDRESVTDEILVAMETWQK